MISQQKNGAHEPPPFLKHLGFTTQTTLCMSNKDHHQTFLDKIKISEAGCWEWQGSKTKGYGKISINDKVWYTHRYAYQHYRGEVGDLDVCHKCDNPACCNPDHLFIGTPSDNAIDMIKKGRSKVATTTPEQVFQIRDLFESGLKRKQIAEIYGVSRRVVETILSRRSWAHLTKSPIKYIAVNAEEYKKLNAARTLLEKVISRHEGSLLPDRLLYNEIKTFLNGTK